MKAAALAGALAVAGAAALWLTSDQADHQILVSAAVARPLPGGEMAALLAIENHGAPDRLIGVSSPSGSARLYSPGDPQGPPAPRGEVSMALDSAHIRFIPDTPLGDGALVPLTLTFAEAGEVAVKARLSDPAVAGGASRAGLFGLGDICVVGEGEPAPAIALAVEPDGEGWLVRVETEDFTFSSDLLGLYHVPGLGHGHLYVGGMKIGRLLSPEMRVGALPPGRHEVRVTLNTNDHRAYVVGDEPVTASATILVD